MIKHIAPALILAAASAASADVVLNLGSHSLAGGQVTVQSPALTGTLLAFVISYDFEPDATAQANGSWASDAALAIQSPITVPVQWGGYDSFIAGPKQTALWSRLAPAAGDDYFLSAINFDETKQYVRKVMNSYKRYVEIYGDGKPSGGIRPEP